MLSSHEALAHEPEKLEAKYARHDEQIAAIFEAIRQFMTPPSAEEQRRIGFRLA